MICTVFNSSFIQGTTIFHIFCQLFKDEHFNEIIIMEYI